jgi:hypothetical protein
MWDSRRSTAASLAVYHPQQSVLYRHCGQRHTACILNISAPQRSHRTLSSPAIGRQDAGAGLVGLGEKGSGRRGVVGPGLLGSGTTGIIS